MTSPRNAPESEGLRISGQPAAAWIEDHRETLIDAALTVLATESAGRDGPPPTLQQSAELRWIVGLNVDLFLALVDRGVGAELTEVEAGDLIASAARRAGEGDPIENLLIDYQLGADAMLRAIVQQASPIEPAILAELVDRLHRYLRHVTSFIVRGFQHEAASMRLGERDARFGLYSALVTGGDARAAAELAGISLPDTYVVISVHLGADDTPPVSGRAPQIVPRRRANAVQRAVRRLGEDALALVSDPTATVLVPATMEEPPIRAAQTLVDEVTASLHIDVHASAAAAATHNVRDAHRLTVDILELALALGLPPGPLALDDVLVPYQLTRPGPGTERIRELLQPLDAHPDWEATLRAYLNSGFDRQSTATAVHVHPNTVDYRLARIAAVSAIDPTAPAQRLACFSGLYLRDLDRYRAEGHHHASRVPLDEAPLGTLNASSA